MKSWGEAESQCPVPHYSHWDHSRGVPRAQTAPGQGPSPQSCWPGGWAGCGPPGESRPAGGGHPAVTLGAPKAGVHCGPWTPVLPLLWEWGWWPMGCPRAAPVICGLAQSRTQWCCPSLPGTVTPYRDQQQLLGIPYLSPAPAGAWGSQTGHLVGVQGHADLGSPRGSRGRAKSSPGPSCPQRVTGPVSLAHRPSPVPLLCQALPCQRPLAPGQGYVALQCWQEAPRILLPSGSPGHGHPGSVPMGQCYFYSTFPSDQ